MRITPKARARLGKLLGSGRRSFGGLRFEGCMGTCRGSTPLLRPARAARDGETEVLCDGIAFFANSEFADLLARAVIDYDSALFGRGLYMTWPHRGSGCPNCG